MSDTLLQLQHIRQVSGLAGDVLMARIMDAAIAHAIGNDPKLELIACSKHATILRNHNKQTRKEVNVMAKGKPSKGGGGGKKC
jgi:hypothetical protein